MKDIAITVVGASWGGLAALTDLVAALPKDFPVPVAVVQHRSKHADNLLASLLQDVTSLRVIDAEDKEPLEAGTVYIAPANYHMMVERGHLSLTTDPCSFAAFDRGVSSFPQPMLIRVRRLCCPHRAPRRRSRGLGTSPIAAGAIVQDRQRREPDDALRRACGSRLSVPSRGFPNPARVTKPHPMERKFGGDPYAQPRPK